MPTAEGAVRYVHSEFERITEQLHESFSASSDIVNRFLPTDLSTRDHAWLRAHNMRAAVRSQLEQADLSGWNVRGNLRLNGELRLVNEAGDLFVRVLRDGKPPTQQIPAAGHSAARRAFYSNTLLADSGEKDLLGRYHHDLLLLWHDAGDGQFLLRVVRPISTGSFRKNVQTDLQLELATTRTDFENLVFEVEEDEEDLLINIAEEELDTNAGNAG